MQDRNGSGPESTVPAATDREPGLGRFHQAGWVRLTSSVQCLLDNSLPVVPEGLEREGSKPCSHMCLHCPRRPHIPQPPPHGAGHQLPPEERTFHSGPEVAGS